MRTCDISGMGGGYEGMCQRMLARGVAYLAEVQPPIEMWAKATEYQNIVGIMTVEGADLKGLEDAIIRKGDDCTGAMHQAVMGHLRYIHKHGHAKWLEEMSAAREPADFSDYAWDGR